MAGSHEVVVLNGQLIDELEFGHLLTFGLVLTALNLSSFAAMGPLPTHV
jgi:hypothetical protein